jgi:hypothetical protein
MGNTKTSKNQAAPRKPRPPQELGNRPVFVKDGKEFQPKNTHHHRGSDSALGNEIVIGGWRFINTMPRIVELRNETEGSQFFEDNIRLGPGNNEILGIHKYESSIIAVRTADGKAFVKIEAFDAVPSAALSSIMTNGADPNSIEFGKIYIASSVPAIRLNGALPFNVAFPDNRIRSSKFNRPDGSTYNRVMHFGLILHPTLLGLVSNGITPHDIQKAEIVSVDGVEYYALTTVKGDKLLQDTGFQNVIRHASPKAAVEVVDDDDYSETGGYTEDELQMMRETLHRGGFHSIDEVDKFDDDQVADRYHELEDIDPAAWDGWSEGEYDTCLLKLQGSGRTDDDIHEMGLATFKYEAGRIKSVITDADVAKAETLE